MKWKGKGRLDDRGNTTTTERRNIEEIGLQGEGKENESPQKGRKELAEPREILQGEKGSLTLLATTASLSPFSSESFSLISSTFPTSFFHSLHPPFSPPLLEQLLHKLIPSSQDDHGDLSHVYPCTHGKNLPNCFTLSSFFRPHHSLSSHSLCAHITHNIVPNLNPTGKILEEKSTSSLPLTLVSFLVLLHDLATTCRFVEVRSHFLLSHQT